MSKNIYKLECSKHTFWNRQFDIMIQILVAHNFLVFFLVSEPC